MTYCVGLKLNEGLVLLSDTRTNAGLDNISTYRKMFFFEQPGERVIAILTAGSLSLTQTTIARLQEAIDLPEADETSSIMHAATMLQVATIIGQTLNRTRREIVEQCRDLNQQASASMIVGGQRAGGEMRLFLVYPEAISSRRPRTRRFCRSASINTASRSWTGWCGPTPRWPMRKRRCSCRWIRRCARTCRWGCRWTWR